jgi:hypothetical protein
MESGLGDLHYMNIAFTLPVSEDGFPRGMKAKSGDN